MVCHWIIGVPVDVIFRARRHGGEAADELREYLIINLRRFARLIDGAGVWLFGFVCFVLTCLLTIGFFYGIELAQAFFCIALPLTIVGGMNLRLIQRLQEEVPPAEELANLLLRHRFWLQVVSVAAIFATAMYGMYHNLAVPIYF